MSFPFYCDEAVFAQRRQGSAFAQQPQPLMGIDEQWDILAAAQMCVYLLCTADNKPRRTVAITNVTGLLCLSAEDVQYSLSRQAGPGL